jgi:hypothetical protein
MYVVILRQQKIDRETKHTHILFHLIMYLVAHATRKPPRPATLFREEDNQTDSSITQFMQKEVDQVIPFLPTWHNLSAHISSIVKEGTSPIIDSPMAADSRTA